MNKILEQADRYIEAERQAKAEEARQQEEARRADILRRLTREARGFLDTFMGEYELREHSEPGLQPVVYLSEAGSPDTLLLGFDPGNRLSFWGMYPASDCQNKWGWLDCRSVEHFRDLYARSLELIAAQTEEGAA